MIYDVFVVIFCGVCFLIFTNMYLTDDQKWKLDTDILSVELKADIYWAQFAYGILSFPFLLFIVPGCDAIMTKARPTGYTQNGVCVPSYVATESYITQNGNVAEAEILMCENKSKAIIEVDDITYYLN